MDISLKEIGAGIVATGAVVVGVFKTFATNGVVKELKAEVAEIRKTLGEINVKLAGYDEVFQYIKELRSKS